MTPERPEGVEKKKLDKAPLPRVIIISIDSIEERE
jgi:hypothetical protein